MTRDGRTAEPDPGSRLRSLPGPRALVGALLLGASGVAYFVYGAGIWDPFPQKLNPTGYEEGARPVQDASRLGIGRAPRGFRIDAHTGPQSAAVTTAVAWRATGESFAPLPAPDRGYLVDEPRFWIEARDPSQEATFVSAPRGHFSSPTDPGPLTAELEGHVHVERSHASLDTERATLTLPPGQTGSGAFGGESGSLQNLQLDRRVARGRLETASPVHARFLGPSAAAIATGTIALEAEGGASADASLHRILLRGPVHAKDDAGTLVLEAHDHVLVTLMRSRADLMASFGGLAGALGGQQPLVPAFGRGQRSELERLEAQGSVTLHWKRTAPGRPPVDLDIAGDYLLADTARGLVVVLGSPAVVEERARGQSIRARVIFLRDRGEHRIDFSAVGGARLETRLAKARSAVALRSVPGRVAVTARSARVLGTGTKFRELSPGTALQFGNQPGIDYLVTAVASDTELTIEPAFTGATSASTPLFESLPWILEGDEAVGTLLNTAKPEGPPVLDVLEASIWSAPGQRASAIRRDGGIASVCDLLTVEKPPVVSAKGRDVQGPRDTIRAYGASQPVWLWTRAPGTEEPGAASCLAAREVELTQEKGQSDVVHLGGAVRGHLGPDVAGLMRASPGEAHEDGAPGQASVASAGPWDVQGERVDLDIWPKALDKDRELAWWERTKLRTAHVEDSAEVSGVLSNGEPARVAGRAIDLDLVKGRLAVAPVTSGRVAVELAGTRIGSRTVTGDLRSGRLDARGDVHARQELPPGPTGVARFATLDAARANAIVETDEARLETLRLERARERRQGRRELSPPPELLAFTADGNATARALVQTSDGGRGEADRFEWDAATKRGFARSHEGAPRVQLRSPRGEALAREAEVVVETGASGAAYQLELTDEVRLDGTDGTGGESGSIESDRARAEATALGGAGNSRLAWGPVVAWSTSERPVIVSSHPAAAAPTPGRRAQPPTEARGTVLRLFPGTSTGVLEAPGGMVWAAAGASWIEALRRDPLALERGDLGSAPDKGSFALRAPEVTLALKARDKVAKSPPTARPGRPRRGDESGAEKSGPDHADASLRELQSLHAPGPVVARWNTQTYEATALDYDGSRRCATLKGPGRVKTEGGRTGTFQRAALTLGDPDVNDR